MHIVEQEQDRVQSIVLFGLALFTSTEGGNTSKEAHEYHSNSKLIDLHMTKCTQTAAGYTFKGALCNF